MLIPFYYDNNILTAAAASINQFIRAWTISLLTLPITFKVNTLRIVSTDLIIILTIKIKPTA